MTDTANTTDLRTADTIFLVTASHYATSPAGYLAETYAHFDDSAYRADVAAGLIDNCVNDDWNNVWANDADGYATEEEAQAEADRRHEAGEGYHRVVEITKDAIRAEIDSNFSAPNEYPVYLGADNADQALRAAMREHHINHLNYAREIARDGAYRLLEIENGWLVITTNANPVWEEDDGFNDMLAAHGWTDPR